MKYKVPVQLIPLEEGGFIARCDRIRATATGGTAEEAIHHLQEAITDLVKVFGEAEVFQEIGPGADLRLIEVAV